MRRSCDLLALGLCLLALSSSCAAVRQAPRGVAEVAHPTLGTTDSPLLGVKFDNGSDKGNLTFEYFKALDIYYFATAAYCNAENIEAWDSGRKVIVHPNVTEIVAYNTTVPLLWNIEKAPVLFFALYYPRNDTVVLSFQGTQGDSLGDWVDDFMFAMSKPPMEWAWPTAPDELDVAIRLEDGFMYAWEELRREAYDATKALLERHPNANFIVTGHSLGGAIASLAAADLEINGLPVDRVYTFGAPRVGNLGWAYFYNELLGLKDRSYRVVNQRDPVPHIPYTGVTFMRGYHHIGIEVWLDGFNFTQCNDVLPYEECRFSAACFYNEDSSCSASQSICLTPTCIEMHVGYYGTTSDDKFCKLGC